VNYMAGGIGDDQYVIDGTDAILEIAGEGNDRIYANISYALSGGASVETLTTADNAGTVAINLTGNEFANLIIGNAGINVLNGAGGNDVIDAKEGNDTVYGGLGDDTIYGGAGNDLLYGGTGTNYMAGGIGDDQYVVDSSTDTVAETAGEGNDRIYAGVSFALAAGASVETLTTADNAGTTAINLTGNEFANLIQGNAGNNVLNGAGGNDVLDGKEGNDTLYGGANDDTLYGGGGNDNLFGGTGTNYLAGGAGDDLYFIDSATDTVAETAGEGADRIFASLSYTLAAGLSVETLSTSDNAGTGAINLTGNELANTIIGNAGANLLDGGAGNDLIDAKEGNDTLNGGTGNDTLYGRAGADTFAFTTTLGALNIDTIADFTAGSDKIQLGGAAGQPFVALATGTLRTGTLVIGSAALDADDYLIYNSGTGALLYDADGNGAGAAVQFAVLTPGLGLAVTDFLVAGPANNAPTITSAATASVAENSVASTIVYQTAATDADGDRITYSLTGADAGLLSIDANGAVRLLTPADFETKPSYVFNVVASDSGVSTTKAVTLTITDVNETPPGTPIINETAAFNDDRTAAQSIDRGTLAVANNPNLYNDDYPSATIVGSISALGDVDFYSITLQAGDQIILDIDNTTGGLDSFLTLYRPNGTAIGENDDLVSFDPGSNPPFGHNTDSQIILRVATGGTYYFSVASFEDEQGPTSTGGYSLHVSVNNAPVTPEQIMAEDVDALVSGARWNDTALTYGFPTQASQYPNDFEEVTAPSVFEAFNPQQQAATRLLLQMVANVSELTFTELTGTGDYNSPTAAAHADLRFAQSSAADVAYAYYPTNGGPDSVGGSAWFNGDDFEAPVKGNYAWMGILHEAGHALGLKHGHEFPQAISADHDSLEYSVMTYRSYPGGNVEGGYRNEQFGYPQTLMMLDIAALQKIYEGANYDFNSGASTYTWSATTGEMSINGTGQGAPGANRVFMTVWDGGGNDTYDLSNYANGVTVDLRPGEWTTTNEAQLANLNGSIANPIYARGNIANALLYEGSTLSAIENAKGGGGADTLIANQVANSLTGNGGADIFKWMSTAHAGIGALADTVLDFVRGTDKLDFSNLDANPAVGGQQDFAFIGTGAFTNAAGQVRFDAGTNSVFADADGNGVADMQIILTGINTLAASDFNF